MALKLQTIIVPKAEASSLEAAKKIAKKFGTLHTHRETSTSFRFRQRPPEEFKPGSFRTKHVGKVSLVFGATK